MGRKEEGARCRQVWNNWESPKAGKVTFSMVPIFLREGSISFIMISGALDHVLQDAKESPNSELRTNLSFIIWIGKSAKF